MIKPNDTLFNFSRLVESVEVVQHQDGWKVWFEEEEKRLTPIFGENLRGIQHVGSSAVPALVSKPIVDILIGLNAFEVSIEEVGALENLGYEYFGRLHKDQERLFVRFRGERSFNLQIVPFGEREWQQKLIFRDYLRSHPEAVAEYGEVKLEAIKCGETDLISYHRHKEAVVVSLLERATEWAHSKG